MKAFIASLLILIQFCTLSEIHEVLKFPMLVQHYYEHKHKDNAMTFFQFINKHYDTDSIEHDTDTQLPFKSHADVNNSNVVLATFIPKEIVIFNSFFKEFVLKSNNNYFEEAISSSHLATIWQPPRLA